MLKKHLTLTDSDQDYLTNIIATGTAAVKLFKRATALPELDRGKTLAAVAQTLAVNYNTVARWRDNYLAHGG